MLENDELKNKFINHVEANKAIIYKICRLYTNNKDDFNDLRQEILFQLWKSFPDFKEASSFSTWMYRIALNTAFMKIRNTNKSKLFQSIDEESLSGVITNITYQNEDVELLYECIQELNDVDKALMILKLEGYDYKEISAITAFGVSNISVRVLRSKEKLKELLIKKGYKGD